MVRSTKKNLFIILLLVGFIFLFFTSASAGETDAAYKEIEAMFIAPDFCGKTLAECPATVSENMRQEIKAMLQAGNSKDQIVNTFVNKYGYEILAAPPKQGFFLTAWVLPVIALVLGIWIMYAFLQRAQRGKSPAARRRSQENQPIDLDLQERIQEEVLRRL